MKFNILTAVAVTLLFAACSGNGKQNIDSDPGSEQPTVTADVDIRGAWFLENIVFSDSECVRPSEVVPDTRQYMIFEDSTYTIRTNCNSMSGPYTVSGDSIWLGDGPMTEMACDNMATEDALRRILPNITTVDVENDTIARLNGSVASEYILLRKADEKK